MQDHRETLCSFIEDARRRSDDTAFIERHGVRVTRWSYSSFARTACQMARELEARGIGKGDRVILWGPNGFAWVSAFFGCLLGGAVAVPLDEQNTPEFAARVEAQVGAKLALRGQALEDLIETIRHHSDAPYDTRAVTASDLAEIIFTSGTTAEPKGVCLTHRNLLANLIPLEKEMQKYRRLQRLFHPVRFLCLLPLSHVFGQFMGIFIPQLLGGEVFFGGSLHPGEIVSTIRRERISVAAAVPRQLETLRENIERSYAAKGRKEWFHRRFAAAEGRHFLRRWWMFRSLHRQWGWKFVAFVSGGATLDEQTEAFWLRLGFGVVQGYGMTETASLISVNHPFKPSRGSIGKTLPGQEVRLGEGGEILVRGENVSSGYWRGSGFEGWLPTGDIGALDAEGNLFFKGRQKDVIVTAAGVNVYPEDLEAELRREPEVLAACVIGPEPMAVLILREESVDPAEVVKGANTRLSSSQQIRRWALWDEPDFPRTPTQKIRKAAVREKVVSHNLDRRGGFALNEKDLRNLDSLGRVALLGELEERYQIELDEAALTAETTVQDLDHMIRARAGTAEPALEYPYPRWALRRPVTWLRELAFHLLIVPFVSVMCWPRARGHERLARLRGPALFVSNHVSVVDPGMILFALPSRFRRRMAIAMGGERLRGYRHGRRILDRVNYVLAVIVFNVFAIPQKSGFRRSFSYAGEAVDRGFNVLIFPEGRITQDGEINPFMAGIGLLATSLNVPVVPVKIEGLFNLKTERRYFSRPGTVTVTFGEPIEIPKGADPLVMTRELEARVRRLG